MNNIVCNFTPTGMIPTKEMNPNVPIAPYEIIEQVYQAHQLDITIVHLHARDEQGAPTHKMEIFAQIISGIRSFAPELIICVSLSGRSYPEFEKRSEPLNLSGDLQPDMGSLTLSSLNFANQASMNSPDMIRRLAKEMLQKGVLPELEAFDIGMVNYANYLIRKSELHAPYYMNLIVGNIASAQFDLGHIDLMLRDLPSECTWTLGGIGKHQFQANALGIILNSGVRVGLEDNLYLNDKLTTNIELLKRTHDIITTLDKKIMTSAECRKILKLRPGNGQYGRAPFGNSI